MISTSWKIQEKEAPQGNFLEFFLPDTVKPTLWTENFTRRWTQPGLFFPKSENCFQFSKRANETSPLLPSCVPVSLANYASISLNMSKYSWKYLNKLFWLCQRSGYTWSSYMFDRLSKKPRVLNKSGFWIRHHCICKGYVEFQIYLIMALNASVIPEYALICLNVPQYTWACLDKLFCLCHGSQYAAV